MLLRIKVSQLIYIASFLLVGLFIMFVWNSGEIESNGTSDVTALAKVTDTPAIPNADAEPTTKTILLWNTLYKSKDWGFGLGDSPFRRQCTGFTNCRTTADKADLAKADAVIFHIADMQSTLHISQKLADILPARAKPGQVYVFWNHEPPVAARRGSLVGLKGIFNVTITYRPDSTIPLPLHKITRVSPPDPEPNADRIMSKKTNLACWVVSACQKTHSHRFEYAKELSYYMDFDIYGKCGNHTCPEEGVRCFELLSYKYKFYFAFENSYCQHYITEKPFRTLKHHWVPIVLGASNYSEHLPPKSFIDVRNFHSPKELAQYLRYLDQNDTKYMEYLQSKRHYKVVRQKTKEAFCRLCEILHTANPDEYEHELDPDQWWEQSACVDEKDVPEELHLKY